MQSLYSEHRLSAANSTIPLSTLVPNRSVASSGFVVHFPDTERQHSMVVMPNVLVGILPDVWRSYQFCAWDGDTVATVSSTTRRHEGLTALQERFLRTLYGLSLYLEAFPDTVQKADPHDFAGDTERHGETVRVTRNDHVQVAEGHKHGMSAHWRSGFYRMYPDDERWPNARGKVIWIEPTFVRGSAMEILEDGEENPVYHIGSGQLEAVAVNQ